MIKRLVDRPHRFIALFNPDNGFYIHTGKIDEKEHYTGEDPFMAPFPQLIDIGIMGHCIHGVSGLCLELGVQSYQSGSVIKEPNMKIADYRNIIDQCRNNTFQVVLGCTSNLFSIIWRTESINF